MLCCFTENICVWNIIKNGTDSVICRGSRTTQAVKAVFPETALLGNFLIYRITVYMWR